MTDPEHKDISDPTYSAADFRAQVTGGRLRWFASVLAVLAAGLFVYFLVRPDKAEIDFPVIITGPAAFWIVGIAFVILAVLAVVNWKTWLGKKKDSPKAVNEMVRGRCVLSGALTTGRLGNGDFMCPEYIEGFRRDGELDANLEYTDLYFSAHPHLKKVVRDGHVYAVN